MLLLEWLNICAHCFIREVPEVKDIDMLHALDYGTFNLNQLKNTLRLRKMKDKHIEKTM